MEDVRAGMASGTGDSLVERTFGGSAVARDLGTPAQWGVAAWLGAHLTQPELSLSLLPGPPFPASWDGWPHPVSFLRGVAGPL